MAAVAQAIATRPGYGLVGLRPAHQVKPPAITSYQATYTGTYFHLSPTRRRGVMGPLGSGKSTACCWELHKLACQMPPNAQGRRRSRWVIIRNTYRELKDTTLETWLDWFPDGEWGHLHMGDFAYRVDRAMPDGTHLEAEFLFRALDRPADIKKLLSLNITGGFINEAREIPWAVVEMADGRCGRFPPRREVDSFWYGLIMDTNPPDTDHWWYRIFEESKPNNWELFRQPGGMAKGAENLQGLPPGYYQGLTEGRDKDWIGVYVNGNYGFVREGKAVYPEYNDGLHYRPELDVLPGISITVGIDFGLTPAAAFLQQDVRGRFRCFDELVTEDMGIIRFAGLLQQKIQSEYPGYTFKFVGDPAGEQRDPLDEGQTVFKALRAHGVNARPCVTNAWTTRRESLAVPMSRLWDGLPGFVIGPKAPIIRKGLMGGYQYKRLAVTGAERFHDAPDKNRYSHPVEAAQYGAIGAGSNPARIRGHVTHRMPSAAPGQSGLDFDPFKA